MNTLGKHMKNTISILTALFLFLISTVTMALEARVDRTTLPENETLQLELSGTFSAFNLAIDLSPLDKNFRVLDNRRSTNMQYINGSFSAKTTLTVTLEPKRAGILTIPPITIEGESSQAIDIKVTKAGSNGANDPNIPPPLDIEVTLDNPNTWVQAQMLLTIKLYQSVDLYNLELQGIKELQQLGLDIEKIGENKTYQSKRNNITYRVTELNYLMFADNPGSFQLPEFIFEGQMPSRTSRYGKRLEARAEPITVTIKDIPKDYPSATWIPARDLQISDDLGDTVSLELGDSLNRNFVISVYGQEAAVIPDLPEFESELVSVYRDTPELNNQITPDGVTGVRMDNIALISKQPGELILPEIQIPWFNTTTGKTEVAKLPSRVLKITGGAGYQTQPVQPQTPSMVSSESPTTSESATGTSTDAEKQASSQAPSPDNQSPEAHGLTVKEKEIPGWFLLIFALITGIAIVQAAVIWRLYQRTPEQAEEEPLINQPHTRWDTPLPADFVACFRLIQKGLQQHALSLNALPESTQALINQFRAAHYGASNNSANQANFTEEDKEKLRSELQAFFEQNARPSQGPTLYPQ